MRRLHHLVLAATLVTIGACSGDDDRAETTTPPAPTVAPTTAAPTTAPPTTAATTTAPTSTAAPATTALAPSTVPMTVAPTTAPATAPATVPTSAPASGDSLEQIVATLADDAMGGRDDGTAGSRAAQEYLAGVLATFAEPAFADGYVQSGPSANVVGIVRGTELPDEYLVLGAHYDGLGSDCHTLVPDDTVCNGATDNATGTAAAIEAARRLAAAGTRRSLVIALWDREEDGLRGSSDFVADPPVPLDTIVGYLNWDIQGSNLLPSLLDTTFVIGAETGGAPLAAATRRATDASALRYVSFSLIFGQGRSDHAVFVAAGIPAVFFTDVTNGCYHTTGDDLDAVDFARLAAQADAGAALAAELADTDDLPVLTSAPPATFADAEAMLAVTAGAQADADLLTGLEPGFVDEYLAQLEAIVAEGEDAFDGADIAVLLEGAGMLVAALAQTECDGYVGLGG